MPRTALRSLEPSMLLRDALAASTGRSAPGTIISLYSIDGALAAAKRQQRRIARGKRQIARGLLSLSRGTLFADVHFYVICWARIAKLSQFISRTTRFRRVGLVLRRYHPELDEMIQLRDHLEHFEERLPGGTKREQLQQPNDLFNMADDHATFGGHKFDVGPNSLKVLRAIVAELRTAVMFDSLERLDTADPQLLMHHLHQAQRSATTARLIRQTEADLCKRMSADPRTR